MQQTKSSAPQMPEIERVWEAISHLTDAVNKELVSSSELKVELKNLCSKFDMIFDKGTPRCADHNARIDALTADIKLIDTGEHPACVAHTAKLKNWVYGAAATTLISIITTGIAIYKLFH